MSDTKVDPTLQNVHKVLRWLKSGRVEPKARYFDALRSHLQVVRDSRLPQTQELKLMELIYEQAIRMADRMFPMLRKTSLPILRRTRTLVISAQSMIEELAQAYADVADYDYEANSELGRFSPSASMHHAICCLSKHLLLSYLAAMPARTGAWQTYHDLYRKTQEMGLESYRPSPETLPIRAVYLHSLLISCLQPASYTSPELLFLNDYITLCVEDIRFTKVPPLEHDSVFWVDPDVDQPALNLGRSSPANGMRLFYFDCHLIAEVAGEHYKRLRKGEPPKQFKLAEFASSAAGLGVLRRVSEFLGKAGKRRFQRRRCSERAQLCPGVDNLWLMLISQEHTPQEVSEWMLTNESAEGCALMHLSGETKRLRVGDIVTYKSSENDTWEICLVRWALSENAEHIELGLQILSPTAMAAELVVPRLIQKGQKARIPVVILPELPPVRNLPALVIQANNARTGEQNLVLIKEVAAGKISLQDIHLHDLQEQTGYIEVFIFETLESSQEEKVA